MREFQTATGRNTFVTASDWIDAESVRLTWRVALGVLGPVLSWAKVDLFPDPSWGSGFESLSPQARTGWEVLQYETKSRKGMGAAVDLAQDQLFDAFRHYGIESIHAVASGDDFAPPAKGDPMVGDRVFNRGPQRSRVPPRFQPRSRELSLI